MLDMLCNAVGLADGSAEVLLAVYALPAANSLDAGRGDSCNLA